MKLLIKNIKSLIQVRESASLLKVSGAEMKQLPTLDNAYLAMEDGLIVDFGKMEDWPGITDWSNLQVIDASDKLVFPCWCDSHTHLVYAGTREGEFVDRINGLTYEEIANRGGGILNSAKKLHQSSEEELIESALSRINQVIRMGTGAIEIKSGYGLSFESELKMLRVIKKIKEESTIPVKATFLGAHAIPAIYKENRKEYLKLITEKMLPVIADQGLADFIDVFCDRGFFTPDETSEILEAGWKYNIRPKIHANELDYSGGIQVGVKHNALSVDHLEFTGDDEIKALLGTETMPTLLPSTAFFLKLHYAPARKMIDSGLPVALATDFNPGSSPSGNMPFVLSLACIHMNMDPEEAINAATINSAYAMGVSETNGTISPGRNASFFITQPASSPALIPYAFGSNLVNRRFINGKEI